MYLLKEKIFPGSISADEIRQIKQFYKIRRMPEYFLSLLYALHQMELSVEEKADLGIIYASHLGPVNEVGKYVNDLLTFPPDQCSPAYFSHSVFNAPVAFLTKYMEIYGSSLCLCGFQQLIESSVQSAYAWLECGYCRRVLIIYSDDRTALADTITDLTGLKTFQATHILLLSSESTGENPVVCSPETIIEKVKQQYQCGGF